MAHFRESVKGEGKGRPRVLRLPPFSDPGVPQPLDHWLRTAVSPVPLKWLCCGLMSGFTLSESAVGPVDLAAGPLGVCSVWSEHARPAPVPGSAAGPGPGLMFAEPPPGGSENTCLSLKTTPPRHILTSLFSSLLGLSRHWFPPCLLGEHWEGFGAALRPHCSVW